MDGLVATSSLGKDAKADNEDVRLTKIGNYYGIAHSTAYTKDHTVQAIIDKMDKHLQELTMRLPRGEEPVSYQRTDNSSESQAAGSMALNRVKFEKNRKLMLLMI
jgi:O-glycosyl hydrolase